MLKYSVIIPVYNRPTEIKELLESLTYVNHDQFEVIVIEDGSTNKSETVCEAYSHKLNLTYYFQNNQGPGPARNKGAELAKGEFLVFFDSDCIIPQDYFSHIDANIENTDCFGGPDSAHESFSIIQKAINYSMTSSLTTGGIRGGQEKLDKFYPRSFNLGVKKEVFQILHGFSSIRFGEDLDFSMRLLEKGFSTKLIKAAFVFHKRRNNFKSFFKQVYNSGIARINLTYRHPGTLKAIHLAPSIFTIGYISLFAFAVIFPWLIIIILSPIIVFFSDALIKEKKILVAFVSSIAALTQILGYGSGFLTAFIKRVILKKDEFHAFNKNFYK